MAFPSQKLLFEAYSHQFLTQNSRKGFWQPRGTPGGKNGRENRKVGWPIYRESLLPTPKQSSGHPVTLAYVRWSLHSGPKGVSYVHVLSKGYSKSSVHPVVPCTFACTICRVYARCPLLFVRATDRGVRPAPESQFWASIFKGSRTIRLSLRVISLA